jgi:tetratricopeptide (TPR) repeat protein
LVAVKLHAEKEGAALAQKFGVSGLPAIIFLDPSTGKEISRIGGYMPVDSFVRNARSIIQLHKTLPVLEARSAQNPADTKIGLELLRIYASQGRRPDVDRVLTRISRGDASGSRGHLVPALLLAGEADLEGRAFSRAKSRFTRALPLAKKPEEKAYALIRIGACDASESRYDPAIAAWKKAIALPGCPPELKETAQMFIQRAQSLKTKK